MVTRYNKVLRRQNESKHIEILEVFHTSKEQYQQIFLISHKMNIIEMIMEL